MNTQTENVCQYTWRLKTIISNKVYPFSFCSRLLRKQLKVPKSKFNIPFAKKRICQIWSAFPGNVYNNSSLHCTCIFNSPLFETFSASLNLGALIIPQTVECRSEEATGTGVKTPRQFQESHGTHPEHWDWGHFLVCSYALGSSCWLMVLKLHHGGTEPFLRATSARKRVRPLACSSVKEGHPDFPDNGEVTCSPPELWDPCLSRTTLARKQLAMSRN